MTLSEIVLPGSLQLSVLIPYDRPYMERHDGSDDPSDGFLDLPFDGSISMLLDLRSDVSIEQDTSPWIWRSLVGLVFVHIGAGIALTLTDPTGPQDVLAALAGIAAGLAVVISIIRLWRIYAARRS